MIWEPALLLIAVLLDIVVGEPPLLLHPVYWMGRIVTVLERVRFSSAVLEFVYGALVTVAVAAFALLLSLLPLPWFTALWHCYLLFSSISVKSMVEHAERCIRDGIDREAVQMIVSRDTSKLSDEQLCSAVIESVAENYVDGLVSPLFYFSLLGLPGVMFYKAVNTCDAMMGYRTGRYEYFGKFAARLDDVLNYIPSRLSLLFFEILKRGSAGYGLRKKVKLNGCTIAAMSHLLGVKLEKPGKYSLPGRNADVGAVEESIRAFKLLSLMAVATFATITAFRIILLAHLQF